MEKHILEHYKKTGTFTYAGGYGDYFRSLPDDVSVLGRITSGVTLINLEKGVKVAKIAKVREEVEEEENSEK